jgi:hypothetical protein
MSLDKMTSWPVVGVKTRWFSEAGRFLWKALVVILGLMAFVTLVVFLGLTP